MNAIQDLHAAYQFAAATTVLTRTADFPAKAVAFGKERVLFQRMTLYKMSYVTTRGTKGAFFSHEAQDWHIFGQSFR